MLFTEHDMDVVFEHADRILVLNRGSLIAEGSPEEVRRNAQVRAIYLGEGLTYPTAAVMSAMLAVEDLNSPTAPAQMLFDVAFVVREGEVVALLGRNGAGKSTTFRAIVGLVARDGRVRFEGREIAAVSHLMRSCAAGSATCRRSGASSRI